MVLRNEGDPDLSLTDLSELSVSLLRAGPHEDRFGLTQEEFETVLSEALDGVPEYQVESVREKIAILDPSTEGPADAIDWLKAKTAVALQPDFKARMIESLIATACDAEDAPYVARGIVNNRLDSDFGDLGKETLPLVEALLAVGDCPGAEGMNQKTIDRLKELKKLFTSDGAAPKNGAEK